METQDKNLNQRHAIKLRIDSNLKMKLDETASRLCLSRNAIILLLIDEGLRKSKFIVNPSKGVPNQGTINSNQKI